MKPPEDLSDPIAIAKWNSIVEAMPGTADAFDLDALAAYCRAFAEEKAAQRLLDQMPNAFLTAADGKVFINPLRTVIEKSRKEQASLRRELRRAGIDVEPMPLDERAAKLLAEIDRRHREIADRDPKPHERQQWEDEIEYGPLWHPKAWFNVDAKDDAALMRWSRAKAKLVSIGMIAATPGIGTDFVKLTEEGLKRLNGETPIEI